MIVFDHSKWAAARCNSPLRSRQPGFRVRGGTRALFLTRYRRTHLYSSGRAVTGPPHPQCFQRSSRGPRPSSRVPAVGHDFRAGASGLVTVVALAASRADEQLEDARAPVFFQKVGGYATWSAGAGQPADGLAAAAAAAWCAGPSAASVKSVSRVGPALKNASAGRAQPRACRIGGLPALHALTTTSRWPGPRLMR